MKKNLCCFLLLLLLLFQCKKNEKSSQTEINNNETETYSDVENKSGIDFTKMQNIVDNSKEMNIDVFFAISVLHKKQISEFEDAVKGLSDEEQKIFFEKKRKDFFKSIKYSEEEYNKYMETHIDEMNLYINEHKEISEYLISIN